MIDLPDISGLTAKQRSFVEAILGGQGDTEAYRTAGYSQNCSNQDQAYRARNLKKNNHISTILTNFRLRNAEKMDLTAETHTRQLLELAGKSEAAGQYGAAIRALELTGKVAGHYVERIRQEEAPRVQDAQKTVLQVISELLGDDQAVIAARKMGVEWLPARDTDDSTTDQDKTAS